MTGDESASRYNDFHNGTGVGGGQFASGNGGGGGKTPAKKPAAKGKAPTHHAGHHTATQHHTPSGGSTGTLAYDPANKHGTGYGYANGDAKVHTLQAALNRLGLKDADGKALKDDGKLGPKTTAAVKAAQRRLGLPANGQVTQAFLKQLASMKSLPATHHTAAHHPKAHATAKRGEDLDVAEFPNLFVRSFALQDIAIRSGGDGRTVEAYAAVFDTPAEIQDGQGHYTEVIDRTAFNRTIANNAQRIGVFYNHGMNLYGQPSDRFSVPIGTPQEIRADGRGLLTVTRYNNTPQADEVLEAIRSGGIAGYSFTGRLIRSDPGRPPRGGYARGPKGLATVRRHELGLTEYGPTPMPAYNEAAIVGVRAALRQEILNELRSTPDGDPDIDFDTPDDSGLVADDPPVHSVRQSPFARRLSVALTARGMRSDGNETPGHH